MKAFLRVNTSLAPALAFWVLAGFGHLDLGFGLGAALGLGFAVWNWRAGRVRPMDLALLGFLALGFASGGGGLSAPHAVAASFLVQGLTGLATCAFRRPWTADYADADQAAVRGTTLFFAIHMGMSLFWAALFLVYAALGLAGAPAWMAGLLGGFGALVSIFAPTRAVRFFLNRTLAARETYRWTQTPFATFMAGENRTADDVDVAVVGAGLGGLTAAALLAQSGLRVFVADQHDAPGGYCHSFVRKARVEGRPCLFRFDAGVHDISGVRENGPVSGLLDRLGLSLDWARMRQSAFVDGAWRPVPEDWRDYARELGARHPASAAELMRFFETAAEIYAGLFYGAENTSGVPIRPRSVEEMLAFADACPLVPRWLDKPFAALVAEFDLTEGAREELYRLAGYVTDKRDELTVLDMIPLFGYYFHGGFYPRGGSGALGEKLAESVARDGGEIALKTAVKQILVEDGAARGLVLANGRVVRARAVISNADLKRTVLDLLPPEATTQALRARFAGVRPATSAFMVHLGLDRQPEMSEIGSVEGADGLRIGLVSPSLADPSAAPPGLATLELIALLPLEEARVWFGDEAEHDDKRLRFSDAYKAKKRALGDRMIALAEQALPGLSASIVFRADASPVTFQRYDWSSAGSIYGVAKRDRFVGAKSPVRDLWLAGAGNHGPGVEAVMIGGAAVAEALRPGVLSAARGARKVGLLSEQELLVEA